MKRQFFALLLLLPLSSCQVQYGSFKPVGEDSRDKVVSAYFEALSNAETVMPEKFTYQYSVKAGYEEERKPIFGDVVYKKVLTDLTVKTVFNLPSYSYTKSATLVSLDSSGDDSSSSETRRVQVETRKIYVEGSDIVTIHDFNVNGEVKPQQKEKESFDSNQKAKDAFSSYASSTYKDEFLTEADIFYDRLESLPSKYDQTKATLFGYTVATRDKFPGDIKIELIKYSSEKKETCLDYYLAEALDYQPYRYRSINRQRVGSETLVNELNVSLSKTI